MAEEIRIDITEPGPRGKVGPEGPVGPPGEQGPEGPVGPVGAQGDGGDKGDKGEKGDKGTKGDRGEKGDVGNGLQLLGRYETLAELAESQPQGKPGDAWAVGSDHSNTVYIWNAEQKEWQDVGALLGPQGEKGDTGADGQAGTDGKDGADGEGVPAGGKTGQVLVKASDADHDTTFADVQTEGVRKIIAGEHVHIDESDPEQPIISAEPAGVSEIVAGKNITVDSSDPSMPIVSGLGGGAGGGDVLLDGENVFTGYNSFQPSDKREIKNVQLKSPTLGYGWVALGGGTYRYSGTGGHDLVFYMEKNIPENSYILTDMTVDKTGTSFLAVMYKGNAGGGSGSNINNTGEIGFRSRTTGEPLDRLVFTPDDGWSGSVKINNIYVWSTGKGIVTFGKTNLYNTITSSSVCIQSDTICNGVNDTFVGHGAGEAMIESYGNTFIGSNIARGVSKATGCVAVGHGATITSGRNQIALGRNSYATGDNQIALGDTGITQLRCQVTSISALSDTRTKEYYHAADKKLCMDTVLALPTMRYKYKEFAGTHLDREVTGFIADDVERVFPKTVHVADQEFPVLDDEGEPVTKNETDPNTGEVVEVPETFLMKDVKEIAATDQLVATLWGAVQYLAAEVELIKQGKSVTESGVERVIQDKGKQAQQTVAAVIGG